PRIDVSMPPNASTNDIHSALSATIASAHRCPAGRRRTEDCWTLFTKESDSSVSNKTTLRYFSIQKDCSQSVGYSLLSTFFRRPLVRRFKRFAGRDSILTNRACPRVVQYWRLRGRRGQNAD